MAASEANGGRDALTVEDGAEVLDRVLVRPVVAASRVVGDQVDLVVLGVKELGELNGRFRAVIDPLQHHVLNEYPAPETPGMLVAGVHDLLNRVLVVDRHDP